MLRDALEGLPCLQSRKMKNQGELESEESGYTERNFEYPDTSFYHFINGDRVVKNSITIRIDIIIRVILKFIAGFHKVLIHCTSR